MNKYETTLLPILLQPLSIPEQVWFEISMDFIESLPPSHRYNITLVVVDWYIKYGHFIALTHSFIVHKKWLKYLSKVFMLHGFPKYIVSEI